MIEIRDSFDPNADGLVGGKTTYDLIDDFLPTESGLRNRIAVSLAGMAAEAAVFGDRSIGAGGTLGSDIDRATTVARSMVGSYGLGRVPVFSGTVRDLKDKMLPRHLEAEVSQIVEEEWERVLAMLIDRRERVLALATELVKYRSLKIERGGEANAA